MHDYILINLSMTKVSFQNGKTRFMKKFRSQTTIASSNSGQIFCRQGIKNLIPLVLFCPSVHPSVCSSVRTSVCPSVCPSVCLSICPSVCLSVCPSVRLSVSLSVRLSVCIVLVRLSNIIFLIYGFFYLH